MHMMLSRWLPSLQHGRHSRLGRYILYACRWGKTQLLTLSCVRCLFCNQLMIGGSLLSLSRSRLGSASNKLKHGTANTRTHKHQRSGNQTNAQTFNTIGKLWWRLYFPWPSIAPANFGFEIPMGFWCAGAVHSDGRCVPITSSWLGFISIPACQRHTADHIVSRLRRVPPHPYPSVLSGSSLFFLRFWRAGLSRIVGKTNAPLLLHPCPPPTLVLQRKATHCNWNLPRHGGGSIAVRQ